MADLTKKKEEDGVTSLRMKVAEKIKSIAPHVEEQLTERMVTYELNRICTMIQSGLDKLGDMEKEMRKLDQPDVITFDVHRNEIKNFSKNRIEEIKKLEEKMRKLNEALNMALGNPPDVKKLEEFLKNNQSTGKDKGGGGEKSGGTPAGDTA